MREIYFATFLLGKGMQSPTPRVVEIIPLLEEWLFDPRHSLPRVDGLSLLKGVDYTSEKSQQVRTFHSSDAERERFALRFEHPDSEDRQKIWRTEVGLIRKKDPREYLRFSMRVSIGRYGSSVLPLHYQPSRPRLVPKLISTFGAFEAERISERPFLFRDDQSDDLMHLLQTPQRSLPLVFVSVSNTDRKTAADPLQLANRLAGVAYVVRAASPLLSWRLSTKIGSGLNTYNGAIRLYWPNFLPSDSRFRHPIYVREQIAVMEKGQGGFASHLLRKVAAVSTHRRVADVFLWEDAERLLAEQHLAELREARKDTDLLALYESENTFLQNENRGLKTEVADLRDELQKTQNEAENWRLVALELQKQVPGMTLPGSASSPEAVPLLSVEEAVQRALEEFGNSLAFSERAIDQAGTNRFKDAEALYKGLGWLATTYRACRSGHKRISDLEADCKKSCGFNFSSHQSDITTSKYKSDYTILWNGKKQILKAHIGRGNNRSPETTIRVAFFWDETSNKVVVGYIGQHQQTDVS